MIYSILGFLIASTLAANYVDVVVHYEERSSSLRYIPYTRKVVGVSGGRASL